jgi:heme-degrading monooxygenase HmoA
MASVVLINPFEVPEGSEAECLEFWEEAAQYMRRQPGFISTQLHEAMLPASRFYYINVACWESEQHFQAAVDSDEFKQLVGPYMEKFPHYPGLYHVIRTLP